MREEARSEVQDPTRAIKPSNRPRFEGVRHKIDRYKALSIDLIQQGNFARELRRDILQHTVHAIVGYFTEKARPVLSYCGDIDSNLDDFMWLKRFVGIRSLLFYPC